MRQPLIRPKARRIILGLVAANVVVYGTFWVWMVVR